MLFNIFCSICSCSLEKQQSKQLRSQQKFGIIAAVSQNHVIGVNGKIPWNLPEDTSYYREVTRGKVVITGRVSFEETCDQSHLSHARWTVLISRTSHCRGEDTLGGKIKVCRSFDEAIDIANDLAITDGRDCSEDIDCWIVGGERVFEEAFRHPALHELRLTRIKVYVDDHQQGPVAKFPATYRWDYRFKEINKWEGTESGTAVQGDLRYSFHVYQCFRPR
jgi:dihydrofolate reductase